VKIAHPTEEEEWEQRIKPALPDGSEVLGEIPREVKAGLVANARAVLFPIDWDEPFGLVMTEAMACGTPVIATPRGSVPEVIADGETGFIVSVERFAEEATERLAHLDEISPAACRERVDLLFDKEAMVEGYERVFDEVVGTA
jgi:glycosyltransferase involved in cell wall biosynthesis